MSIFDALQKLVDRERMSDPDGCAREHLQSLTDAQLADATCAIEARVIAIESSPDLLRSRGAHVGRLAHLAGLVWDECRRRRGDAS